MSIKKRVLVVLLVIAIFVGAATLMTATFVGCTASMAQLIIAIRDHDASNVWLYGLGTVCCGTVFTVMFGKLLKSALKD